ncbi:hypothetical protein D3C80_2018060 [compost metagenome]
MTIYQRITVCRLTRDGFRINHEGVNVCVSRGNSFILVWPDGSMHRAEGAKR